MTTIPISSCHKCSPKKWKRLRDSAGSYHCLNCRKIIHAILRRKGEGK